MSLTGTVPEKFSTSPRRLNDKATGKNRKDEKGSAEMPEDLSWFPEELNRYDKKWEPGMVCRIGSAGLYQLRGLMSGE
jgi:hypothetical protein